MPLFKQILSDRDTLSFVAEQFADDKEALAKVQELKQYLQEHKTLQTCRNLFKSLQEFERAGSTFFRCVPVVKSTD